MKAVIFITLAGDCFLVGSPGSYMEAISGPLGTAHAPPHGQGSHWAWLLQRFNDVVVHPAPPDGRTRAHRVPELRYSIPGPITEMFHQLPS